MQKGFLFEYFKDGLQVIFKAQTAEVRIKNRFDEWLFILIQFANDEPLGFRKKIQSQHTKDLENQLQS